MVQLNANPADSDKPKTPAAGTPEAPKADKPPKEEKKRRKDFASWGEYCAYQQQYYQVRADNFGAKAKLWHEKATKGEGADKAQKMLKRMEKMSAALEVMNRQLEAMGIKPEDLAKLIKK